MFQPIRSDHVMVSTYSMNVPWSRDRSRLSIHIMWSIPQSRDVQRRKLKTIKYSVRDTCPPGVFLYHCLLFAIVGVAPLPVSCAISSSISIPSTWAWFAPHVGLLVLRSFLLFWCYDWGPGLSRLATYRLWLRYKVCRNVLVMDSRISQQ